NSGNLISDNTTAEEVENVLSATASVLNSALSTGAALDEDLAAVAVQVSLKAVSRLLPDFAETVGQSIDVNDLDQVRQLMAEPVILESAINNSIAVNSNIDIDESTATDELQAQGVNADAVSRILAGLRDSIANPDGVTVSGDSTRTATTSLLNALLQAFGGSAEAISA